MLQPFSYTQLSISSADLFVLSSLPLEKTKVTLHCTERVPVCRLQCCLRPLAYLGSGMRSRSLISADCSLTLHFCHRAGSRDSCQPESRHEWPEDLGGNSECLSGHFVLPVYRGSEGDRAPSVYLQVHVAGLNDPLFNTSALENMNSGCT